PKKCGFHRFAQGSLPGRSHARRLAHHLSHPMPAASLTTSHPPCRRHTQHLSHPIPAASLTTSHPPCRRHTRHLSHPIPAASLTPSLTPSPPPHSNAPSPNLLPLKPRSRPGSCFRAPADDP